MEIKKKNLLFMIIAWGLLGVFFPTEVRALIPDGLEKIGLMGVFIVPITLYVVGRGFAVNQYLPEYESEELEDQLDHLIDCGDLARLCGLIGTLIAFAGYADESQRQKMLYEAICSTLAGGSVYALARAYATTVTAPKLTPKSLAESGDGGSHE